MYIRCILRFALLVFLFDSVGRLSAAEPQRINYQGRIAVSGANFTGTGLFKFALVDAKGSTTFWSNDGTSAAGAEPTASVPLTVNDGFYTVLLGDTALSHMTLVPEAISANTDVFLRVWFDDGINGVQLLTPDQRIVTAASVEVADPGSMAEAGLVSAVMPSSALVDATYVRIDPSAPTAAAGQEETLGTAPAGRYQQTAVWTGSEMIVWGGFNDSSGYLNDGGRYNPATNSWTALPTAGAPAARDRHTAVWTGSEMIVWGGSGWSVNMLNDGARYNPATNSWTALPTTGAPTARRSHTAVWTGSEMIVWGGGNVGVFNDGGRFSPATNSWTALPTTSAPTARLSHTAVWTGSEMIVWGGNDYNGVYVNSGGRYNPTANSWATLTPSGAPSGRIYHTAVWTGNEMVVWGGYGTSYLNDGGRYNPVTNSWIMTAGAGSPAARYFHTAIWTGSEMIVWGGIGTTGTLSINLNDGRRYNPLTDSWTTVAGVGAPGARYYHTAVWTGSEMIVWGGWGGYNINFDEGGRYDPVNNGWISMTGSIPVITTQPASQSVIVGNSITFSVTASGTPAPTLRWQVMSAGFGAWVNLSDGGSYAGSTTASLTISNVTGVMSGDQFRCVATNSVGSATSAAAILTVNVIFAPSNAIVTITVE